MDKLKVLFVDDDIALGNIVMLALNDLGYEAHYQSSLTAISSVITELNPDIIILDVEIGLRNGIDAAPEIKMLTPQTPILFVSSHIESSDVIRALNAGGIAYLKKPFEIEELLAYISRHAQPSSINRMKIGTYDLCLEDNTLYRDDVEIKKLSLSEFKLLKLLASNINHTITRKKIEDELWGGEYCSEHSLNNFIAKLRKYISDDEQLELITIPKIGYKLVQKK